MAEFEATAPFSIHLERPKGGFINMLQRSVDSGTFVAVKNFNPNYNATQVIDADCGQGAVYPKWIRLESAVEPSVAEVTFESESSGGGAGSESGGVKFRYFDANKLTSTTTQVVVANYIVLIRATKEDGTKTIACFGTMLSNIPVTPAPEMLAVITGTKVILCGGELSTFEEACAIFNITEEELSVAEITKEQFYNLEA